MNKPKNLEPTVSQLNTFTCVECGTKYSIQLVSKKVITVKPKYCKYCKK